MTDRIITLTNVSASYQNVIVALQNISLSVKTGSIVALLGANGAGKTTTLKGISNLLKAENGAITGGSITFDSKDIKYSDAYELVNAGLVQVLEGRRCFPHLSVEENLLAGAYAVGTSKLETIERLETIYGWLPRLKSRRNSLAGLTSGGEQQMLAIGRALISRPRVVLLDEPSMGLAPIIVKEIFEIVRSLNQETGTTFVLAEQNLNMALKYSDYGYVLENGQMVLEGLASELIARTDIHDFYLGGGISGK
tara:strand:+ start:1053 stop:1808 length:756 start_codon:yes stop_codon:yes gene_type:complete